MNTLKMRMATLVLAIGITGAAQAALIASDWKDQGDALLTVDTDSGLEWLDFGETFGRSYLDVSENLGDQGEFPGFRYATREEVKTFLLHAGVVEPEYSSIQPANIAPITHIFDLMGRPYVLDGIAFEFLIIMDGDSFLPGYRHTNTLRNESPYVGFSDMNINNGIRDDDAQFGVSSYLVRAVPEPETYAMMLAGLVLVGAMARRRKLVKV